MFLLPMTLHALFLAASCCIAAFSASLRTSEGATVLSRASVRSDVLGVYELHPSSKEVARPFNCPHKITTNTFEFQVTNSPSSLEAPPAFNILIPHVNSLLSDQQCESSGSVIATTHDHPFVQVESNPLDVITYWAGGGTKQQASWVTNELIDVVSRQPFVVGYDFTERSCRGVRLRPGTAFLWFQPAWDIPLGTLQLTGRQKYLLLTFRFQRRAGCIYVAEVVGGEGDFALGPVSDPSVDAALDNPGMVTVPPTVTVPPSSDSDSEELPESDEEDENEEDDDAEDQADSPSSEESDQTEASSTFTEAQESSQSSPSDDSEQSDSSSGTIFGSASEQDDGAGNGSGNPLQGESESEGPACFSGSSMVQLEHGPNVQMRNLKIGHRVQVRHTDFSDVFFFSHRMEHEDMLHNFVRIRTEHTHVLTLSEGHYVYVNGHMSAAGVVSVGDRLQTGDGSWTTVASIERVKERGLYAPHTIDGDIVVDGIRVSTYTTAVHPRLAHHVLLAPVRLLYRLGVRDVWDRVIDGGARDLHRFLPRGPPQFGRAF